MENSDVVNAPSYMYEKLWELCAGPFSFLPEIGENIFYFPQGHMELVDEFTREELDPIKPIFELPSKLQCHVVAIDRRMEKETDEVYAQITLMPNTTNDIIPLPNDNQQRPILHSFIKVLTTSDSSTQGGLTLLKKQANECLPPLDMSQPLPSQILVAKDLHGNQWSFKHIFRGTPKRHLITTGWNAFITSKRLVAGDAVIFLRGETGELRVGVRRVGHQQGNTHSLLLSTESMKHGLLASAVHAFEKKCMFVVVYKPRSTQFLVSYEKYIDTMNNKFDVGSRFTMRFEGENFLERRYSGTVIGIKDFSPHWKDSEWRNLQVQWDEYTTYPRPNQVSAWEIEHLSPSSKIIHSTNVMNKRSRQNNEIGSMSSNQVIPSIYQAQEVGQLNMSSFQNVPQPRYQDANEDFQTSSSLKMSYPAPTMPTPKYNNIHIVLPIKETIITNETTSSRFFGVDLTTPLDPKDLMERTTTLMSSKHFQNKQFYATRSCTKVQMQSVAIGRGVDLTALNGYDQLIQHLEELFDLKGELKTCNQWELVFIDVEGDLMLVGDDPWPEFCNMVKKIFICSKEEAKKMKSKKVNSQGKSTSLTYEN